MKIASSEHVMYTNCSFVLTFRTIYVYNMFWACNSTNDIMSYCGLVDARIGASEEYSPVNSSEK